MIISFNELLFAVSYALDCIEGELLGVSTGHAKRVAYICVKMGKNLGLNDSELDDLSACAVLHDNALTQFISNEYQDTENTEKKTISMSQLSGHCIMGEQNVEKFPFFSNVAGVILYHHENEDGSGPFGRTGEETPLYARLIHFADILDLQCNLGTFHEDTYDRVKKCLESGKGTMFAPEHIKVFFECFDEEELKKMATDHVETLLFECVPKDLKDYPSMVMREMTTVFASIIDYKSQFTTCHSVEIAQKAAIMAKYYGYDAVMVNKLYIAGALHDIGKLAISNDVLEKPDKLTDEEFSYMKNHAWYTWKILNHIEGMEDIAHWASYHHEKLNGKGYPFGKTAEELDKNDRLMGCIDIYQALTEERPYKPGMSHGESIEILYNMAEEGFIDADIVKDIDYVFQTKEEIICQN